MAPARRGPRSIHQPTMTSLSLLALLVVGGVALVTWTCTPEDGDASSTDPGSPPGGPSPAPDHPDGPPGARWDMVDMLRQGRDATYGPADGGGRAWIETEEGADPIATAGMPGRWTIVYEAGEALRFDEVAIRAGVQGVMSVMRGLASGARSAVVDRFEHR